MERQGIFGTRVANEGSAPLQSSPRRADFRWRALPAAFGGELMSSRVPLATIRPQQNWAALDLRGLWEFRDLFYFLAARDIKVRYKQTVLGASWAVIQPLFSTLVFSLFFGKLAKMPSDGLPYPVYTYAAMTLWTFLVNAVNSGGNSLVGNANLITKVYFPRIIMPAAAVGAGLVDLAIAFVIQLGLNIYYAIPFAGAILMAPVIVLLTTLLASAVGLWMSALNVKYRDVRFALPFFVQLWMFATPVIYPPGIVPERYRWLLSLNPMTGLIDGFRSALFNRPFDWSALGISTAITFAMLIYATFSFRKMEMRFADVI
ncbi:MAG TPA: ABC transporter permease [Polyangiaceae bacterium]|nr:ABC transporter permease [Polyangiaceae bacterium]